MGAEVLMKNIRIGVGDLVSFLYASGDLSSETFQNVSLLEGTKAHQYLQSKYTSKDQSEVFVSHDLILDDLTITLSGRIDGLLWRDEAFLIEEIKSTRKSIFDPQFTANLEHHAQLKMYAYMYLKQHHLTDIKSQVTYIQLSDYKTRSFGEIFDIDLLEDFFKTSIETYLKWLEKLYAHYEARDASLKSLIFPFDVYRRGQREMMAAVYQTMMEDDILYAIAPTGIGKTMAALFSTLKALKDYTQKIFYLTAKTQGKKVALDTMDMLHEAGLKTKTLELTSKDSICFLEKRDCDPEKCPFAKGFFDRLRDATIDIFDHEVLMTRAVVERYAQKHMVCPFEFSLYVSYFVDVMICDYNYVFDPTSHLIRYFDEDTYQPLLLIDEAHNLVSRSRDMYSETLSKTDLITLRKHGSKLKPTIRNAVKKVLDVIESYDVLLGDAPFMSFTSPKEALIDLLYHLLKKIEKSLKENPKYHKKSDVMDGYIALLRFLRIYEYYNESYVTNVEKTEDDIKITLQCLDASSYIYDTIKHKTFGATFFSATLYPIEYYQKLLTKGHGETLKIKSPYDPNHLKLIFMNQVSTRYQDRSASIQQVVDIIQTVISSKQGNYIVFFPSYQYLNQVLCELKVGDDVQIITQYKDMRQAERDETLDVFKNDLKQTNLAFFVMGGMFAEGIDYVGDMLHGVIVVGVGLPMLSDVNQQLKDYYDQTFSKGFDYAYTYPGMNKVIQAVGRVIRRDDDYGVAILIDDRFTTHTYKKLFPLEWKSYEIIKENTLLKKSLDHFWQQVLDKKI